MVLGQLNTNYPNAMSGIISDLHNQVCCSAATAAQSDETCLSRQAAPSLRAHSDAADRAREAVPLARCGAS